MKSIGILVLLAGVCFGQSTGLNSLTESSSSHAIAKPAEAQLSELRTGAVVDLPVGMGYSHPRLGGEISGDLFRDRMWVSAASRLLWAGKLDGGQGLTNTNEGTANISLRKNIYIGGGTLWTITSVRDYSKSAFHPLLQAGTRFHLSKSQRLSLLIIRYTAAGTDRRNDYREVGGILRVPFAKKAALEQSFGLAFFHGTDNPLERRTGFVARLTFSYAAFRRAE